MAPLESLLWMKRRREHRIWERSRPVEMQNHDPCAGRVLGEEKRESSRQKSEEQQRMLGECFQKEYIYNRDEQPRLVETSRWKNRRSHHRAGDSVVVNEARASCAVDCARTGWSAEDNELLAPCA